MSSYFLSHSLMFAVVYHFHAYILYWGFNEYFSRGEHGFDFAIKTPCTPARWDNFDAEMAMAWEVCYS